MKPNRLLTLGCLSALVSLGVLVPPAAALPTGSSTANALAEANALADPIASGQFPSEITREEHTEPCQLECVDGQTVQSPAQVSTQVVSTNPICITIIVKITIRVTAFVFLDPPGIWAWVYIYKTIYFRTTICVWVSVCTVLQSTQAVDGNRLYDTAAFAHMTGLAAGPAVNAPSAGLFNLEVFDFNNQLVRRDTIHCR